LLPAVAPRLDGLLAAQGLAVGDLVCPPAAVALARSAPHAVSVFGNISKFLSGIASAKLKTAASPFATRGTAPRVGRPTTFGGCKPAPGRTCTLRFPISKKPFTQKLSPRGAAVPPALVIGVQRADGQFADDHYELDLLDTSVDGEVELEVTYANDLASCEFDLALAVMEDGEVSTYTKVEQEPHAIPANDQCVAARPIGSPTFTDLVDTAAATVFDGEPFPTCAPGGLANTVWYQFTAPANGIITADTFGSDYDTQLAVWTGSCALLTERSCVDDSGGTPQSKIALGVAQGTTYLIQVGVDGDPGDTSTLHFAFRFEPAGEPPSIAKPTIVLEEVNAPPGTCDNGGSLFRVDVDFSDVDGDVLPGTASAEVSAHFLPSGNVSNFPIPPGFLTVVGDGFSGHVGFGVCYVFASDTSVETTLKLVDLAGAGNAVTVKTTRPAGAN
jgi:hypothetical protein